MKLALTLIFAGTLSVLGQQIRSTVMVPNPVGAVDEQEIALRQARDAARYFVPTDPWRLINGTPTYAKGPNWVEFTGRVVEVQPNGIRVMGGYGELFLVTGYEGTEFFVADYPFTVAENEYVGIIANARRGVAYDDGSTYRYTTVAGGSRTLRKLEYGIPCAPPPPTPEQLEQAAAAKKRAEASAAAAKDKALEWNQEQAAKSDPYGLLRMGERYRDGDGVPKDLAKARDYLSKAAAAGDPSAADELSRLGRSTNAPTGK